MATISCDPNVLVNSACCFTDMSWRTRQAIRILNWCAFLNSTPMDCNPQALVIAASDFINRLSAAQMDGIETYLSCQVASGGGGGGAATHVQYFNGHYAGAAPGIVPTETAAIADDLDSPYKHWVWNGAAWI